MGKYPTEKALINLVNDLTDDLRNIEPGDVTAHIAVMSRLNRARKALAAHRQAIRECEDKAR